MRLLLFTVWTVVLAEIACGLRSAVLTAEYRHPLTIYLGTMIGTAIIMVPAIFLGEFIGSLDLSWIRWIGGLFFMLYGLAVIGGKV